LPAPAFYRFDAERRTKIDALSGGNPGDLFIVRFCARRMLGHIPNEMLEAGDRSSVSDTVKAAYRRK